MDLKEFGAKVVKLAPAIGGAFLGPGGAAAGMLLGTIAEAFGLKCDAKPDEVISAINADPEAQIKLRGLEVEQQNLIAQLNYNRELEQMKADLENVKSAREREQEITKATGKKETTLYILAWIVVTGFFASFILVVVIDMPSDDVSQTAISMLLGALISSYRDIMNYFFGSSKGSAEKTQLIATMKAD